MGARGSLGKTKRGLVRICRWSQETKWWPEVACPWWGAAGGGSVLTEAALRWDGLPAARGKGPGSKSDPRRTSRHWWHGWRWPIGWSSARRCRRRQVSSLVAVLRPKSGKSDRPSSSRESRGVGSGVYLGQRRLGDGGSTAADERWCQRERAAVNNARKGPGRGYL
jgi:hypothetical protein